MAGRSQWVRLVHDLAAEVDAKNVRAQLRRAKRQAGS